MICILRFAKTHYGISERNRYYYIQNHCVCELRSSLEISKYLENITFRKLDLRGPTEYLSPSAHLKKEIVQFLFVF
jgi:hypothetical protein